MEQEQATAGGEQTWIVTGDINEKVSKPGSGPPQIV